MILPFMRCKCLTDKKEVKIKKGCYLEKCKCDGVYAVKHHSIGKAMSVCKKGLVLVSLPVNVKRIGSNIILYEIGKRRRRK